MREVLNSNLRTIQEDIIKMGTMIESAIENTIEALVKQDAVLAEKVVSGDDVFDKMELDIESKCISIIAMQQPVAKDLRKIISVVKIASDLERIADHCQDISRITLELADQNYVKPLVDLPKMAKEVKKMVKMTIDCYIDQDVEKARAICENDDVVDEYFKTIFKDLQLLMESKCKDIKQCMEFFMIAKYFERMADHSTNIAEWVIYSVEGTLITTPDEK